MNKLDLVIEDSAERDIYLIADYIVKDNKKAALKLVKEFYKSFELFCLHPQIGFERKDFTYRSVRFYVVKKNYLIVYTIIKNYIHILRVLSAYQDICSML